MIGLDHGEFAMRMVAIKGLVLEVVEIDRDDIHMEMALIE